MRIFIGLAVLSVAFANPIAPVVLPEPPAPAFEPGMQLPKAEVPTFEIPDMGQLIIPHEVFEAMMAGAQVQYDPLVDAVMVVEHPEVVVPLAQDIVDPVKVVDVAENNAAGIPFDLTPVHENSVHGDGVIVVDHFVIPEPRAEQLFQADNSVDDMESNESAVDFNDIAANPVRIVDGPIDAVVADAVNIVDAPLYPEKQYQNPLLR